MNYKLRAKSYKLKALSYELRHKVKAMSYELRATSFETQVASFELRWLSRLMTVGTVPGRRLIVRWRIVPYIDKIQLSRLICAG
jgi:hypothetical protein